MVPGTELETLHDKDAKSIPESMVITGFQLSYPQLLHKAISKDQKLFKTLIYDRYLPDIYAHIIFYRKQNEQFKKSPRSLDEHYRAGFTKQVYENNILAIKFLEELHKIVAPGQDLEQALARYQKIMSAPIQDSDEKLVPVI